MSNFPQLPKFAGGYVIGREYGLRIDMVKKPNWLHRKMMLWCFGITWVDL